MKIEVSIGEIFDKITILEIKLKKIDNRVKLTNVQKEYDLLAKTLESEKVDRKIPEFKQLKEINLRLWEIEDKIRVKEAAGEFDEDFIQLARSVYFENDKRAEVKKKINLKFGSDLVEEKQYIEYKK